MLAVAKKRRIKKIVKKCGRRKDDDIFLEAISCTWKKNIVHMFMIEKKRNILVELAFMMHPYLPGLAKLGTRLWVMGSDSDDRTRSPVVMSNNHSSLTITWRRTANIYWLYIAKNMRAPNLNSTQELMANHSSSLTITRHPYTQHIFTKLSLSQVHKKVASSGDWNHNSVLTVNHTRSLTITWR